MKLSSPYLPCAEIKNEWGKKTVAREREKRHWKENQENLSLVWGAVTFQLLLSFTTRLARSLGELKNKPEINHLVLSMVTLTTHSEKKTKLIKQVIVSYYALLSLN